MYANLLVSIHPGSLKRPSTEEVYAWSVEVDGRTATIFLDANDGEGNYSVPAGERVIDLTTHAISVTTDY